MAKCDRRAATCPLPAGCSPAASRLFPPFSDAALRRRIVSAFLCGASSKPPKLHPPDSSASRRSRSSDRLSDLFKADPLLCSGASDDRRRAEELKSVVVRLGFAGERRDAAGDVRRLARDDVAARDWLAAAGAIEPLVAIVGEDRCDDDLKVEVLYALLNLGIGNDTNKAAMVQAGILEKILFLVNIMPSSPISEAIVAILLGLSALDSNKPLIGSSPAVSFLISTFQNHPKQQARYDSHRALFNLSLSPSNASYLTAQNVVPILLNSLSDMEISDRSLAILSNLVSSADSRAALSSSPDAYSILIDVLTWTDSPECQEKAAYVLMVMAHKVSMRDRTAMIDAGIVTSLLEVMLVGSALAQKRAGRVLECLRMEKGKQVSEGFDGRGNGVVMVEMGDVAEGGGAAVMSEDRRAVRELVRQSLQSNLRRIVSRANLQHDFAPSDRFLVMAGTSKSLPL